MSGALATRHELFRGVINMKLLLIGDVHGRLQELDALCANSKHAGGASAGHRVVQVGDLGLGFRGIEESELPTHMQFLRGNHDNPSLAHALPGYLGDFGYWPEADAFFLSGAWSIDRPWRTEGVDWWREEQLSLAQLQDAYDLYLEVKPRLVISHDCPPAVFEAMPDSSKLSKRTILTRTTQAMALMLEEHTPELWVFGHHHQAWQGKVSGTHFRCLDILESAVLDTDTLQWEPVND